MKPSVILGAVSLALSFACSANSGDEKGTTSPGSGASSSTGATSSGGGTPNLGNVGVGGTVSINPTTGGTGEPDVANGECAQQNFILASKPADVLLVLDRSKSMIEHMVPPDNKTRWDAVVAGLTSVITATDASVSWGLKFFPEGEGSECSPLTDMIPAEIAPMNAAKVNGLITTTMALGNGTPTGDAINKATAYLKSRNASNQFIVLATDGQPSCPSGSDAAQAFAIQAITAAKAAGFPTYVIGVVDPVADKSTPPRLNAMAEAGGTSISDNPIADKFFQAYSQDQLTAALQAVTGQVASCVFEFDKKPPDETNIAVKVNGTLIAQDTSKAEGWDYTSDQYMGLELHGEACKQVKDATDNKVDIIFGCKGQPIK
ncbi:MAG: vWA domain-containing protein [Myxococcales bacterium]